VTAHMSATNSEKSVDFERGIWSVSGMCYTLKLPLLNVPAQKKIKRGSSLCEKVKDTTPEQSEAGAVFMKISPTGGRKFNNYIV
jgi:hypothetical protein